MQGDVRGGQEPVLGFGPFRLLPSRRLLLRGDEPVRLGARAVELLIALVERAGELLSRQELETRAWPRTVVEETSLRVHVSALRRALQDGVDGARYITNVPGRGYCFVAPITRLGEPASPPPVLPAAPPNDLPARLTSVVGREAAIETLVEQMTQRRLVSVLGPGGIGKTTVAVAAAQRLCASHGAMTACFVDLSLVSDPARTPAALAAAFGLADFPDDPLGAVSRLIGTRPTLLLLDNCEHVVDAVARLAMALLERAPGLRLLATSREAIGLDGEWPYRLPALDLPGASASAAAAPITTEEALQYSAVRLFVERARARVEGFRPADEDAELTIALCRRLDGNPLAIEVAAARLEQFGLRGLASQLDTGLLHLKRDRRTGASRHEALSAMLDWSHALLTPTEQKILRRVAIFRSPFQLRSAIRVAADAELGESEVVNGLAGLRAKSLLNRVSLGDMVKHQLLELTRVYALDKLRHSEDEAAVRGRHALLVADLLDEAQRHWPTMAKRQWMAAHGTLLPAIQTALSWAFSPGGDPLIGASLTAASWPMARYLFLEDYESAIHRAIEALEQLPEPPLKLMIQLHLGLASHVQERLGTGAASRAAYDRAAELAALSPDPEHRIDAQIGQVSDAMGRDDGAEAVAIARRMREDAAGSGNEVAVAVADRLVAQSLHFSGDQNGAHRLALAVRDHPVRRGPLASLSSMVDHRVSMEILLARSMWLQGAADQAADAARNSLQLAELDSAAAVCQSLALAVCPVLLWRGEDDEARLHATQLLEQARRLGSGQWLYLARGYLAIADARRHPGATRPSYWTQVEGASFPFAEDQLSALDASQWHEASLTRVRQGQAAWCAPEIWRQHALRRWAAGADAEAQTLLGGACALARSQGATAWALRGATSLARLLEAQGRRDEALAALGPVYAEFREGADTADLRAAAALLAAWGGHALIDPSQPQPPQPPRQQGQARTSSSSRMQPQPQAHARAQSPTPLQASVEPSAQHQGET